MEIGASLAQLELFASAPQALADFYGRCFGLEAVADGGAWQCSASERSLRFVPGESGQLKRASFRFATRAAFDTHRRTLRERGLETLDDVPHGYSIVDPEGRTISFVAPASAAPAAGSKGLPPARLQHFAVRTPSPAALVDYYVDQLGFVLSDRVLDADGQLTAAFMRTDAEHHAMAIFRASETRFDHFSCEAPGWLELREWADHMARVGVDLAWGVGRHGPGNDTFFMVRDVDGNMGEISSDLEQCEPGRPAGVWPHRPQTLNQWGVALMRS